MSFCPENVGNWSFSPQTKSELSPKQSRAVSRFSRGPVAGHHRRRFFDPTVSNTIAIPDRIEKKLFSLRSGIATHLDRKSADGDFLQLGPSHVNVVKGTFSTDRKSNCIIIGLRTTITNSVQKTDCFQVPAIKVRV